MNIRALVFLYTAHYNDLFCRTVLLYSVMKIILTVLNIGSIAA